MKKSILSLLAVAAMVSCTQNEVTDQSQSEIKFRSTTLAIDALTRAPFEGDITTGTNELTALVIGKLDATTDYTAATAYSNGTMIFKDETTAVGYEADNSGKSYYPANGDQLDFVALYPATGWGSITSTAAFTFTGCEDVMAAAEQSASKTTVTPPAFVFNHLLTKLDIVLKAEDQAAIDAWGAINKIELVKAAGANPNTKVEVTLATAEALVGNFATSVTNYSCYEMSATGTGTVADPYVRTYTDNAYTGKTYALTADPVFQAYSLVAPITATGTNDFTFRVYAAGAPEVTLGDGSKVKYLDVNVDLKKSGTAYTGYTQGKAFTITLLFKAKTITATADVTGWNTDDANNDETVIE